MSVTDIWTKVHDLLDANMSVEINATYDEDLTNKKEQVVIQPVEEETETVTGFDSQFNSRNIYNVIIRVFGTTTLQTDEHEESVKNTLKDNGLDGYQIQSFTTIDNTEVFNENKYYNKNITVTLVE